MTLFTGTPLARGRRTVAAALRASGNAQEPNWSLFHQVLNRARWSPLAVSHQRLLLMVGTFVPVGAGVDRAIDETLQRRWGSNRSKRGQDRNRALSSKGRSVSSPGLRWMVMAVVVRLPWTKQRWALPFVGVLATTPDVSERLGKRHQTVGRWAQQMVGLGRRWLADRDRKRMGETADPIREVGLQAQHPPVAGSTTGRMDAVLPATAFPTHPGHDRSSWGQGPSLAIPRPGSPERGNRLAGTHGERVWARQAIPGDGSGDGPVVSLGICSLVHPPGSHACSHRQASAKCHRFHRPHPASRGDHSGHSEALESGGDL
ncbi:MAG TPA: hypothetical protein VGF67_07960 [Ktedonobacteraceae bacterium]